MKEGKLNALQSSSQRDLFIDMRLVSMVILVSQGATRDEWPFAIPIRGLIKLCTSNNFICIYHNYMFLIFNMKNIPHITNVIICLTKLI